MHRFLFIVSMGALAVMLALFLVTGGSLFLGGVILAMLVLGGVTLHAILTLPESDDPPSELFPPEEPEKPHRSWPRRRRSKSPTDKVLSALDNAEAFLNRSTERARHNLDIEDSRED